MLLNVSGFAGPVRGRAAERGKKMKARILRGPVFKFLTIENGFGMTHAENEPDIMRQFFAGVENFREHAANGRDAGACGDENEILFDGRRNDEGTMWAADADAGSGLEIAKVI